MVIRRRLDLTGPHLVFITTSVREFLPVFEDKLVAEAVVMQFRETVVHYGISVIGWALMPTHFHALIGLPQVEHLSDFVQAFKSLSARRVCPLLDDKFRRLLSQGGQFHLWQSRFDDVIIYTAEQLQIKLQYIHLNPVKAGLVPEPTEWPFSSPRDWIMDTRGLVQIEKYWVIS